MRDDPDVHARLMSATMALKKACGRMQGSPHWGDGYFIYEHPLATHEMSFEQAEALHRRPAEMTVDQLTLDECNYYFRHTGYFSEPTKTAKLAFRYFMPRYVDVVLKGDAALPYGFILGDSENFGHTLAHAEWWSMRNDIPDATDGWLAAWLGAAARYQRDLPGCRDGELSSHAPTSLRSVFQVTTAVVNAGISAATLLRELRSLGLRESIISVAGLIHATRFQSYGLRVHDPSSRSSAWPAVTDRLAGSFAALREWAAGSELVEMFERAVHNDQHATEASAALTCVERLRSAMEM